MTAGVLFVHINFPAQFRDLAETLIARGATLPSVKSDSTVSVPLGVWRSIVQKLGLSADSAVADTTRIKTP